MPRRSRPVARHRHSHAHARAQRARYARRRFRQMKERESAPVLSVAGRRDDREPQRLREELGQSGPVFFVHPEVARGFAGARWEAREFGAYGFLWPFNLPWSQLSKVNPWTRCSCPLCRAEPYRERRAQEERRWRQEWEGEGGGVSPDA